jgi:hypothetical protein
VDKKYLSPLIPFSFVGRAAQPTHIEKLVKIVKYCEVYGKKTV